MYLSAMADAPAQEYPQENATAHAVPEAEPNPDAPRFNDPPNQDLTPWVTAGTWPTHQHWFRKGDLVEFYREGHWFNHWGVYMGNGLLVHVTRHDLLKACAWAITGSQTASAAMASDSMMAAQMLAAANMCVSFGERMLFPSPPPTQQQLGQYFVRLDNILLVAGMDKFRVNNAVNGAVRYVQRSWPEVFGLVEGMINSPYSYSVFRSNCEHFATFLRYRWGQTERPARNPTQSSQRISGR